MPNTEELYHCRSTNAAAHRQCPGRDLRGWNPLGIVPGAAPFVRWMHFCLIHKDTSCFPMPASLHGSWQHWACSATTISNHLRLSLSDYKRHMLPIKNSQNLILYVPQGPLLPRHLDLSGVCMSEALCHFNKKL